ncbi:hypothetical protein FOZ62_015234, partial [Perkinsus olseni]
ALRVRQRYTGLTGIPARQRLEGEFGSSCQDVRWLSKLQFLSMLCSSKDAIAAFIARRNMARGDKIAKKDRKKTSASARDGERERFAKRSGLCLFVTAPWSYKEARIYHLGSDDLLAQTDKKERTFHLLGYENRFNLKPSK